jgi:hypothetical protein
MSAHQFNKQRDAARINKQSFSQMSIQQMAPQMAPQMAQSMAQRPSASLQPQMAQRPSASLQPQMAQRSSSSDPVVTGVLAGIDRTFEMRKEADKRHAFIQHQKTVRLGRVSSLPEYPEHADSLTSPEMKQIQAASKPGFYKADGNTYYKSVTGKIQYISPPPKHFTGDTINPRYLDGDKIVNTLTHKTGKIDRFRRMVENTPYYSVTYDDGSSESLESENNLLKN